MRAPEPSAARDVLLALFGVSLAVSISAALVFWGLLVIEWASRRFERTSDGRFWTPLGILVMVFIVWSVLATAIALPAKTLKAISGQSALLLFFMAAHGWTRRELKILAIWFCIACSAAGLWGALQVASGINSLPFEQQLQVPARFHGWPAWLQDALSVRNGRAVGPRSHPLTYAESLMPAFLLILYFLFGRRFSGRRAVVLWGAALALVSMGLLFAEGRAVWVAVFGGTCLYVVLERRNRMLLAGFAVLMVLLGTAVAATPRLRGRLVSIFTTSGGQAGDQQSKSARYALWREAAQTAVAHPVVGVGIKGVRLQVPDPHYGTPRTWSETHNIFLQVAVERGVLGLVLFLFVVFLLAQSAVRCSQQTRAFLTATLLAFLVAGLTESWIKDKEIAMLFWIFAGAVERFRWERSAA